MIINHGIVGVPYFQTSQYILLVVFFSRRFVNGQRMRRGVLPAVRENPPTCGQPSAAWLSYASYADEANAMTWIWLGYDPKVGIVGYWMVLVYHGAAASLQVCKFQWSLSIMVVSDKWIKRSNLWGSTRARSREVGYIQFGCETLSYSVLHW